MRFASTRAGVRGVGFREAMFAGLAPDGGLFVPEDPEPLRPEVLGTLRDRSFPSVSRTVLTELLSEDFPRDRIVSAVDAALDFMVPFVHVPGDLQILELFHGPTLAFKDVGARIMARLVEAALVEEPGRDITVLTATSGDTGGAVASAFHGMEGVRVVVLFPLGRVSELQKRQFTTLGGNVEALGVEGSFDDCQGMVKGAFRDPGLVASAGLTSANSINVGRFIPQLLYYFYAWAHQPEDCEPVFVVPSGNLGNLAAGLFAWRLGLPATGFIAATNANRVLPDYLKSGAFEPRPSIPTVSSAMDVGNPSNLERLGPILGFDPASAQGLLVASSRTDEETLAAIHEYFDRLEYIPDPHTAVGLAAAGTGPPEWAGVPRIVLGTAHPGKFPEAITRAIGQPPPIPSALSAALSRESRFRTVEPSPQALRAILLTG
jgi:threonine synthase